MSEIININNFTKSKKETKVIDKEKSTPIEKTKGVDNTMKKNCYHRKDGRWEYSKQENGLLYYTIANTYRELLEKIKSIKPKQIKQVKRIKTKILTFLQYFKFYIDNYVRTKKIKTRIIKKLGKNSR